MSTSVQLPTLVGRRCTLRALHLSDAPSLQGHADDPAAARKAGQILEGRMPHANLKAGSAIDAVMYGCHRPGLHTLAA